MPAKNHIDLVINTLNVLESLSASNSGKPLKEIASDTGLLKSSAFRILFTLKEAGYVEQAGQNGAYGLTLKTAGLSRKNVEHLSLVAVARPHLVELQGRLDESVALAERRAGSVILVDVIECRQPLRLSFQIGDDCPVHATALGKAVAAFLSRDELDQWLRKHVFPRYTQQTNTALAALRSELQSVRQAGYALNDEETVAGAFLVGAPIFDSREVICGALSVNAPVARCSPAHRKLLTAGSVRAACAVSADLARIGYTHAVA
jgi:DNA-binding IclR family transcriptional regulator